MTVFQGVVPPGGGNVNNVAQIVGTNLGGISFANNITRATGSPVVGDTLRIVSADVITGYTSNVGPNTIANFGSAANPRQVVAVFAGQGTVTSVTGGTMASASLNSGQVNFYNAPANTFNPNHPSTRQG